MAGVFDDVEVVLLGDGHDGVHVGHLAKEVDGDDGFGFGGDGGGDEVGVDVVGFGVDIDEDGFGTDASDAACGGEEGEWCGDDFIAWAYIEGHEAVEDGVGA